MPGRARGSRLDYGWVLVGVLGVLATVSYGILSYSFSVFITPMSRDLGWTRAEITGAFSAATLVSGFAAVPIGRHLDRHGARGVMTAGAVLASLLLIAWSRVETLTAFYAVWLGMGVAMAAVLYEPAFAVVAVWFQDGRGRALTLLTFLGGFASVVFVPLAALWMETYGWRGALVRLALVQAVVTIPLPALALRKRPAGRRTGTGGGSPPAREQPLHHSARAAVSSRSFQWLSIAFGLSAVTTTAVTVHMVPLLIERGYTPSSAAAAVGMIGLMALPGRLVFTPLGDVWSRVAVTASIFILAAVGLVVMLAFDGAWTVWVFVVLFGAGFGAITPARAALVAELYGSGTYGSIAGTLALVTSTSRAAAPLGASLLHGMGGGYEIVMAALVLACLASAAAVMLAGDEAPNSVSATG